MKPVSDQMKPDKTEFFKSYFNGFKLFLFQNKVTMASFRKKQIEFTQTICILSIFNVVLYMIPVCLEFLVVQGDKTTFDEAFVAYSKISINLNPIICIIVICARHQIF